MKTKYGTLKGVEEAEYYPNGSIKLCRVNEYNLIKTRIGDFVPQYETSDERRKITGTLEFYENGDLMSICLDKQNFIETKLGYIPAEKIIFYKNEKIKRIFPLNGKLSAYWDEDKEYSLAESLNLHINNSNFSAKYISLSFYESENIKSLTLWPRENLEINLKGEKIIIRKGISFYEDGHIKSLEPAKELKLETPIGILSAFHNEIIGLNGDVNSVQFDLEGKIKALYTCSNEFNITKKNEHFVIKPELKSGWCNELVKIPNPIKIEFKEKEITFNSQATFSISKDIIKVSKLDYKNLFENISC